MWGRGPLTVGVWSKNGGVLWVLGSVKYNNIIYNTNGNLPKAAKFHNSYFCPFTPTNAAPSSVRPGADAHFRPPPAATATYRWPISEKFEHKTRIDVVINSFGTEWRHFSDEGSFTTENSF